ncbi:hypothetical protein D9599_07315 [Roseomonas sp. KE2513]|nr:hypothetical protein [Roseomonas sp. KE2513]
MPGRRFVRLVLCLGLIMSLAACGLTARSGPTYSAILSPPPNERVYDVIEISASTIRPYTFGARSRSDATGASARPDQFGIAPGDVLNIVIFERSDGGLFAPASTGGSNFPGVRVDEGGAVTLPYAGRVQVARLTLAQAAARITGALTGTAVDPRVHVQLASSAHHSVLVSGEVRTPGRVTLLDGPLTVLDAVARAGGPTQPAQALDAVIYSQQASPRRLPYLELLSQPSLRLAAGDQVILEPNEKRLLVMGSVLRPGLQTMTFSRMSMLDALGTAGGLNDSRADPAGVFVFRPTGGTAAQPTVFHLDMSRGESMLLAHSFAVLPNDILYVSNAPVWEAQKVVAPFIHLLSLSTSAASIGGL